MAPKKSAAKTTAAIQNRIVSLEERYDLIADSNVTLDGKRATIMGAKCDFAIVAIIGSGLRCEFAWATVRHIVNSKNGEFKS